MKKTLRRFALSLAVGSILLVSAALPASANPIPVTATPNGDNGVSELGLDLQINRGIDTGGRRGAPFEVTLAISFTEVSVQLKTNVADLPQGALFSPEEVLIRMRVPVPRLPKEGEEVFVVAQVLTPKPDSIVK